MYLLVRGTDEILTADIAKDLLRLLSNRKQDHPAVILEFDECSILTELANGQLSHYANLCRGLSKLRHLPIFGVFLATGGKFHLLSAPAWAEPSSRLTTSVYRSLGPFTELGFDIFARKFEPGSMTLDTVTSIDFKVTLGRPLLATRFQEGNQEVRASIGEFAQLKLLQRTQFDAKKQALSPAEQLACLSVRLSTEFTAPSWSFSEVERYQVEHHMRFCIAATTGLERMFTIAASEPLFAEAAFSVMHSAMPFSAPQALLYHLKSSGISKGDRGELIVALLLLLARDNASIAAKNSSPTASVEGYPSIVSVEDFLTQFLPSVAVDIILGSNPSRIEKPEFEKTTLRETFKESRIYFTHFIKVQSFQVLSRRFLLVLIARGAAVFCANNQRGIDLLIPFLFRDNTMQVYNVAVLQVQCKNDAAVTDHIRTRYFDGMNPYTVGVFEKAESEPVPIICIVNALASPRPIVTVAKRGRRRRMDKYTSWDIWMAGASSETFGPIKPIEDSIYKELLEHTISNAESYFVDVEDKDDEDLRPMLRRMAAFGMSHQPDHWKQFVSDPSDKPVVLEDEVESEPEEDERPLASASVPTQRAIGQKSNRASRDDGESDDDDDHVQRRQGRSAASNEVSEDVVMAGL
ncbi:hypothetical protein FA95DRAFT_1596726 [Auriscalpium vulgare]|uniref:Uncharacterized protein n=1 Tax=Auriscalpium vulgare TaxID=40419 RepID=A0ACB8RPP4_9AGAM|nr:hypothetical protein FA95DRAFT_1596726 [Auriscalpium vulgare]